MKLGVIVGIEPDEQTRKVRAVGVHTCQVASWNPQAWTDRAGEQLIEAAATEGVQITTFWAGYSGPAVWNFTEGPATIGLVPEAYRDQRTGELIAAAEWAAKFKLPSITTHVGFLPEDPNDKQYQGTVEALKQVAGRCAELGIGFTFETGQETPVNLLRTIERVNTGNLGVNLDPANLIMYGKANPIDALDVFGKYVTGVHAKDGCYPTDGESLGPEKPLGEGRVNFPALIERLKTLGYEGAITIEREIEGPGQIADIREAVTMLNGLIG